MCIRDRSTVTDIEDVSYVCSPYLPRCLLDPKKPMSSNAHRALESAIGESNVKDELDEAITLSRVVVLVGEYLPFGSNQMVELNEKLGTRDPIKGGSFCETTDECSIETNLEVPPGLTQVNINSHNKSHFVNLEAEVFFPEDEGIAQPREPPEVSRHGARQPILHQPQLRDRAIHACQPERNLLGTAQQQRIRRPAGVVDPASAVGRLVQGEQRRRRVVQCGHHKAATPRKRSHTHCEP